MTRSNRQPKPLLYVLSAGRTGTMFLERIIKTYCPEVRAEHEPFPSRYLLMLANMRNQTGLFGGLVSGLHRWHQKRLHSGDLPYVEINPFLCPLTDVIAPAGRPLHIVHMVRNPGDWSQSITTFKASSTYRWIIDYVPFAKPYPAPRPGNWNKLSSFEKSLYRWNWCNSRIAELGARADKYLVVKAESLFAGDYEEKTRILRGIFETLELPAPECFDPHLLSKKVNPAPASVDLFDHRAVSRISGSLARSYGYEV